ncbi:helix-turn-helix domain-containing protein [Bradyrhizobium sp. ERR14]|uniref:helix-turn-helix domain-containing protein n=1 Tax=Bradyrhizobium sp. ERR14 TaxID=2663837 RepID=UPI002897B599|nr:helix-turn-helix domain-containing protein [Bradyrhizobium sp. ERR14]
MGMTARLPYWPIKKKRVRLIHSGSPSRNAVARMIARRPNHKAFAHQEVYFSSFKVGKQLIYGILDQAVDRGSMISPRQIRAARAFLGWSQQDLADRAIVSLNAVARIERGQVDARVSTIVAIERTLIKAGVEFLAPGERGEGVRMKSPKL